MGVDKFVRGYLSLPQTKTVSIKIVSGSNFMPLLWNITNDFIQYWIQQSRKVKLLRKIKKKQHVIWIRKGLLMNLFSGKVSLQLVFIYPDSWKSAFGIWASLFSGRLCFWPHIRLYLPPIFGDFSLLECILLSVKGLNFKPRLPIFHFCSNTKVWVTFSPPFHFPFDWHSINLWREWVLLMEMR